MELIPERKAPLRLPNMLDITTTVVPSLIVLKKNATRLFRHAMSPTPPRMQTKIAQSKTKYPPPQSTRKTVAAKASETTMSFTDASIG